MAAQELPPGTVLRDDGCVCPTEAPPPPCKKETLLQTCPNDPRFPNQNQTRHCYISFIDFQRCARLLGDYPGCKIFYTCYRSLCPSSWYEEWYSQMEKGIFPRKFYPAKPIVIPDPSKMAAVCSEKEEEEPPENVC